MKNVTLHIVDYLIVIVSLAIPILISIRFSKGQNDLKKYFTAGGSLPAWAVGISILATLISSITFLAYPGEGFSSNWILLVQGLMVPATLLFFVGFVVPLYRKVIRLSAYEYFERRFGFGTRLYASLGFFLAHFSKMGTVFYLIALAFSKMTGFNTIEMIWILGAVVIFVTLIGGIEAVVWMDVMQGFILIAGGILTFAILIFSTPGGLPAIWETAAEHSRTGFGPYSADLVNLTFWVMMLNGIFYAIQKYGTDQTIVQRYLVAKSDKQAIKAALMGVLMSVPVWALFMFIGTALFAYYQISGGLPSDIKPDAVFPYFIINQLPIGVVGLVLAALLAAAISSLDSDLNCLSAVFIEDYYLRMRPASSDRQRLWIGKLTVVVTGVVSIMIAQYYVTIGGKGALGIVFTLYSIFSGGIAGLFLLGIFAKKANKQGAYVGIGACILFTAYAVLTSKPLPLGGEEKLLLDLGRFNYSHHSMMLGVYSHIILFVVGYTTSFLFKQTKDVSELTYTGWKQNKTVARAEIHENKIRGDWKESEVGAFQEERGR